jgi:heptosyltransferase-2
MRIPSAVPLIVRLPNWVGDVIMALPALRELEAAGHPLHLLGRGWARDLLCVFPWSVQTLPKPFFAARKTWALQRNALGCKHGVLLTNSFSSAAQAFSPGFHCAGFPRDGRRVLLSFAAQRPQAPLHQTDEYLSLVRQVLRETRAVASPLPDLHITEREIIEAERMMAQHGVQPGYTIVAPLAAGRITGQTKVWPHFAALLQELIRRGQQVIMCPGPGEEGAMRTLVEPLPGGTAAHILPNVPLRAYAALMARAKLVIANDSGSAHLAAAARANTIVIHGVTDPARTGARGPNVMSIGSSQGWPSLDTVLAKITWAEHV